MDKDLVRQAYFGSHLSPLDFAMDNLSETQREDLGGSSARVYHNLRTSLGAEHALIVEIDKSTRDRDVAMMRVAALESEAARACLWAFEMHFTAIGESQWQSTLSYELILRNLKERRVNPANFSAILKMPYREAQKEVFEQRAGELLDSLSFEYLQSVTREYNTFIRPGL